MEDEHWCAWNNKHAKCEHLQRSLHSETIACLVPDWVPVKFCSETTKQNNVKHIHLPQHWVGMFLVLIVILPLFQAVGWWTYGSVCPFKWDTQNARSYLSRHLHATEPTTVNRMLSILTFVKMLPMFRIYLLAWWHDW